jgi:hypothetical protein
MKYIDYINHLKSNNIILFDHDYRISYNNIKNYYYKKHIQTGGSNTKKNRLSHLNKDDLEFVVNLALSSNPQYLLSLSMH